jgi:DNA (cytosine-5)-methyltransferase 1
MNVLDLFSGIGGFSLGLERAGMKTIAFCEIEEFPRKILRKHWPEVPIHKDVRTLHAKDIAGTVDLICGGFPCQDLSCAGKQKGFNGDRSSLYVEILRLIGECKPKYAIFENVAALLTGDRGRWFAKFLYDLAAIGCDAEWHCIPASAVGAPHQRDRVWVIANCKKKRSIKGMEGLFADGLSRELGGVFRQRWSYGVDNPAVCGMDDGVRPELDGHEALGNSVVPQIPELIGRAIMEVERQSI